MRVVKMFASAVAEQRWGSLIHFWPALLSQGSGSGCTSIPAQSRGYHIAGHTQPLRRPIALTHHHQADLPPSSGYVITWRVLTCQAMKRCLGKLPNGGTVVAALRGTV